jgi:hypothetical protein
MPAAYCYWSSGFLLSRLDSGDFMKSELLIFKNASHFPGEKYITIRTDIVTARARSIITMENPRTIRCPFGNGHICSKISNALKAKYRPGNNITPWPMKME